MSTQINFKDGADFVFGFVFGEIEDFFVLGYYITCQ